MMKFHIGQKVSFNLAGERTGTVTGFHNGIYSIDDGSVVFGMKPEDLKGE